MIWVAPVAGALLVIAVLRDVFHTLLHPAGQGSMSMLVFRSVWAATGALGSRARSLAGPSSMAFVIGLWTVLLVVGCALVYWPALPESFILSSSLDRSLHGGIIDAVYFSWVTQATLGYGDIAPRSGLLRVLAPLQATLGFALFTVSVTWVLSIYPALQRQRALAGLAFALHKSHESAAVPLHALPQGALARQLERLAVGIATLRADYLQYPSTFYFAPPSTGTSLAAAIPYLVRLSHAEDLGDEARLAAAELAAELDFVAADMATQFLAMPGASTGEVVHAFRCHHGLPAAPAEKLPER
jgi:hypothetical protein